MQTSTPPASPHELLAPEDIVRELRHLPSTPKVLPRLLEILRDDRASMEDVVELIRIDPGMASRVLQIANSAYYTPNNAARCPNMEEAVYRVGLVKVYELVAFAVTAQLIMHHLRSYDLSPDVMWQRAVSCAIAAERLANRVEADFQSAYTSGLLHSVGMVAIDAWAVALDASPRFNSTGLPRETADSETRVLGFSNAAVAGALMRQWGFPSQIAETVRWQYAPAGAGVHQRGAALLHAAKWLRTAAHTPEDQPLPPAPDASILAQIPCDPEILEDLLEDVKDAFMRASLLLAEPAGDSDFE